MDKNTIKKATDMVNQVNIFIQPDIELIMKNKKKRMIIGVEDSGERFLIICGLKVTQIIHHSQIHYPDLFGSVNKKCIEEFIIAKLNDSWKIVSMSLKQHIRMWQFIEHHQASVCHAIKGIQKYLVFSFDQGINVKLLNHFYGTHCDDLYQKYVTGYVEDYKVILSEKIGDICLIFSYKYEKEFNANVYRLSAIKAETGELLSDEFYFCKMEGYENYSVMGDQLYFQYRYKQTSFEIQKINSIEEND